MTAVETPPEPGTLAPEDFELNRFLVDLNARTARHERVRCQDMEDVLGGCGRGFKLLANAAVDDPYDPDATLVMNLGILSGTGFMTGLRTYFHAYSPLKRGKSGKPAAMWTAGSGKFGVKLRTLGVEEVVFTGRLEKPSLLRLSLAADGSVDFEFLDGADLVGKTLNGKIQHLKGIYPNGHFAVIGPAGENYGNVRIAAIGLSTENQLKSGDPKTRFCGRGGIGGVMGSKNLLAVVADVKDPPAKPQPSFMKPVNMEVARGKGSARFRDKKKGGGGGTWANAEALNPVGAMPEYNFAPTGDETVSEHLYRDAVEAAGPWVVKDEACYRCGIRCHKNVYDKTEDGKAGKFRAKLDYEPLNLLSSNIGVFDVGEMCDLVEMVDEMGMDSISCGVTLAYAMEYNKRHKDDGKQVAGGLSYGDAKAAMEAVVAMGEGRLAELGQGTLRLSEQVGEPEYAMHCKGIEFPAYLPQTNPGYPFALAGGHMSMKTYLLLVYERETSMDYWVEAITGRGPLIMRDDLLGICKFASLDNVTMADTLRRYTGLDIDSTRLKRTVMRVYLRGYMNERRQGFTADDYVMPREVHRHFESIDLPHFNTEEFFGELKGRVLARFDAMAKEEGITGDGSPSSVMAPCPDEPKKTEPVGKTVAAAASAPVSPPLPSAPPAGAPSPPTPPSAPRPPPPPMPPSPPTPPGG